MVCGADLWDVDRYITAGGVSICADCVTLLKDAIDGASGAGGTEVTLPPRVHGSAPDEGAAAAVAKAFTATFSRDADRREYMEDPDELAPLFEQAGRTVGPFAQLRVRIDAMRFPTSETAEVRFQILMHGGPAGFPFQGMATRHGDKWRVTRETIRQVLATAGVAVPPRRF
jgi:hypothetical protein